MRHQFKNRLQQLSREWIDQGIPTREGLLQAAAELEKWKRRNQIQGLWPIPPSMITATLDDGMGYGLDLIERFAAVMGMSFSKMGLLQKPRDIVARCQKELPDFLGLTVLQSDSDEDLELVGRNLPEKTCLIAGGAAFRFDPDLSERCRVDFVAKNVAHFIEFIMQFEIRY